MNYESTKRLLMRNGASGSMQNDLLASIPWRHAVFQGKTTDGVVVMGSQNPRVYLSRGGFQSVNYAHTSNSGFEAERFKEAVHSEEELFKRARSSRSRVMYLSSAEILYKKVTQTSARN